MADDKTTENAGELELYGELGLIPKLGMKVRLARKTRVDSVMASAAVHAHLNPSDLEERLAQSTEHVHDVVIAAAGRAQDVGDEIYLDVLGRLVAGALDDAANIDEQAFLTSEIIKLEPVHLRALFAFFRYGEAGHEEADLDLSPADAGWAVDWWRPARDIASVLQMTKEATYQVLRRIAGEGLLHITEGPLENDDHSSGPTDWACKVLADLFAGIEVENTTQRPSKSETMRFAPRAESGDRMTSISKEVATQAQLARQAEDRQSIDDLVAEIKEAERRWVLQGGGIPGLSNLDSDGGWLALMKRRLRRVDPNNPWAYED